ncbi:MAG: response regulator [Roseburia sp.]
MGGSLCLISEVTKGSTFTVRIPWVEVSEKHHFTKQSEKSMNADYSSFTILAVDDNEQNLMVLEHLLHKTKVKMETVMDGNTAVQKCEEKTYDLLLLDHMMPKPDGIETLHLIRADEKGRNHYTQAVAFTANATAGAKELYKNEGFAEYITKPVKPGTLEIMLQKYLRDYQPEENMVFQGNMDDTKITKLRGLLHYLEKNGIAAEEGLSYADGDEQFYKELLGIFAKEKEKKQHHLEKAFQTLKINHVVTMKETAETIIDSEAATDTEMMNELWKTFVTQSHGLKGEAWGIGAENAWRFLLPAGVCRKRKKHRKDRAFLSESHGRVAAGSRCYSKSIIKREPEAG